MSLSMLMPMLLILMLMIPMTSRLLLITAFRVIFSFNLTTWLFKRTYISKFWPSHDKPIFNFKNIKRILNSGFTFFPILWHSQPHPFLVTTHLSFPQDPFFVITQLRKKTSLPPFSNVLRGLILAQWLNWGLKHSSIGFPPSVISTTAALVVITA